MKGKKTFVSRIVQILVLLFISSGFSPAQNEWQNYINKAWGGKFSPYIEADAGYGSPVRKNFNGTFANIATAELRLGFTELKKYKDYIQALDERYLFAAYTSSDLGNSNALESEVKTKMMRFGIGNRLGFGYEVGAFALIPYNQTQLTLTKPEFSDTASLAQEDVEILRRLEGMYRMGISYEGGVKFYIAQSISVNAGIEGSIIYPRYQVLKWTGSFLLQSLSLGAVSYFSEAIVNSSPFLGPLMYFILKNGVSLAWYMAMKGDMYWPIKSETPLAIQTLKLGASITF